MTLDQIAIKYRTDKSSRIHNYTEKYEIYFSPLKNKKIKLLEIGIQDGHSLMTWKEYFSQALIYGVDTIDCQKLDEERVKTIKGSQNDLRFLKKINAKYGPFDIIIDDGSHLSSDMRLTFDFLFPLLKNGGWYVVEDLNCTYWPEFSDPHYSFMSRLKELLDRVNSRGKRAHADLANLDTDLFYQLRKKGEMDWWDQSIEAIHLYNSIVFVEKSVHAPKSDKTAAVSPPTAYLGAKKQLKYLISDLTKFSQKFYQEPLRQEIESYRKFIKIYDVFTFFNELELLEIRLNILYPYVDYFIIKESKQTFSGQPKELIFKKNRHRFSKFKDKIIYFETPDSLKNESDLQNKLKKQNMGEIERKSIEYALTSDNVPHGQPHWLRDFYQKELLKKALVNLNDNDICFVGDVDEIWNPKAIIDYRRDDIFKLRQHVYAYYLNNRSSEPWAGTLVTKYKNIKDSCLNHLRTARKTKYTYIENGGWHFTNQGGLERVLTKIESYGHQEINTKETKSNLPNRIARNEDFMGRNYRFWLDDSDLPDYIKQNREKYRKLLK